MPASTAIWRTARLTASFAARGLSQPVPTILPVSECRKQGVVIVV